ncbi:RNA polymerase sigma factor [Parapedobacter soli]|uniref:RNA polymerase sigma factor n=1 Tax=Parapedobacter soli TaxID=416955 RepID=UPI0021C96E48|nr:sigma-70 family RNA polymerase sigma factor [Parapedobacter soli]
MISQNHSDERHLLEQLRAGDHDAFVEIYHRYKLRLAGNFLRILKSSELAEELLQELFVRLWIRREQIDPEQSIKSYLFRIGENLIRDTFRKAAKDKRIQQYLQTAVSGIYSHVEELLISSETRTELYHAIDLLPPKRREVFRLCKLESKSYEEVSQLLNISPGTVNDHIRKANSFLRQYLTTHAELGMLLVLNTILYGIS